MPCHQGGYVWGQVRLSGIPAAICLPPQIQKPKTETDHIQPLPFQGYLKGENDYGSKNFKKSV